MRRGKIKIPLWPAVNLRLLTAQRSCCVTGFLMTLQQPFATNGFELIYFSFYKHPTPLPPLDTFATHPALLLLLPPDIAIQPFSFFLHLPLPLLSKTHIYTVSPWDAVPFSAPCQWQGTSVFRSPLPHSVRLRVGRSLDWPVWKGLWAEQGRAGLGNEGTQAETCPQVYPALPASCHLYLFVCKNLQAWSVIL